MLSHLGTRLLQALLTLGTATALLLGLAVPAGAAPYLTLQLHPKDDYLINHDERWAWWREGNHTYVMDHNEGVDTGFAVQNSAVDAGSYLPTAAGFEAQVQNLRSRAGTFGFAFDSTPFDRPVLSAAVDSVVDAYERNPDRANLCAAENVQRNCLTRATLRLVAPAWHLTTPDGARIEYGPREQYFCPVRREGGRLLQTCPRAEKVFKAMMTGLALEATANMANAVAGAPATYRNVNIAAFAVTAALMVDAAMDPAYTALFRRLAARAADVDLSAAARLAARQGARALTLLVGYGDLALDYLQQTMRGQNIPIATASQMANSFAQAFEDV